MLVQSFRTADNEWAIDESLIAACTLCDDKAGRIALLRHGMLKAVQRSMREALYLNSVDKACTLVPFVLSQEAQAMCAKLLAAFAKCDVARKSLSEKPETAVVIVEVLRSYYACVCRAIFNVLS